MSKKNGAAVPFAIGRAQPIVKAKSDLDQAAATLSPIAVIPTRALADKRLNRRALQVLGMLCAHADRLGKTHVSQQRIALLCDCSRSTVAMRVQLLKRLGYVRVTYRKPTANGYALNNYAIAYDAAPQEQGAASVKHTVTLDKKVIHRVIPNVTLHRNTSVNTGDGLLVSTPGSDTELRNYKKLTSRLAEKEHAITAAEVIAVWIAEAAKNETTVIANEADLHTAMRLEAAHVPIAQLENLIGNHYANKLCYGWQVSDRLAPVVESMLSA